MALGCRGGRTRLSMGKLRRWCAAYSLVRRVAVFPVVDLTFPGRPTCELPVMAQTSCRAEHEPAAIHDAAFSISAFAARLECTIGKI